MSRRQLVEEEYVIESSRYDETQAESYHWVEDRVVKIDSPRKIIYTFNRHPYNLFNKSPTPSNALSAIIRLCVIKAKVNDTQNSSSVNISSFL